MKKVLIDVSSLLSHNFVTGIQRVVIEWTLRLIKKDYDNVFLFTMDGSIDSVCFIPNSAFVNRYSKNESAKCDKKNEIKFCNIDDNYILLDIDSVWDRDANRRILYKFLKKKHVKIVSLINDIIPILNPQFLSDYVLYPRFINYIHAIMQFSDVVVFSSFTTKKTCTDLFKKCGYTKMCSVVPFGNDLKVNSNKFNSDEERLLIERISNKPYLLTVGTLEPRKNHTLLFDSFAMLEKENLNLIIAGRIGWGCTDLISRIKKHPMYGKKIFLLSNLSDAAINYLYANCWAFVFPSFDEGFGLPIIEAALHGNPVFCSNINVFKEITQKKAIYFNNTSPKDLCDKIVFYKNNIHKYLEAKEKIRNIKLISWDESVNILQKNIL